MQKVEFENFTFAVNELHLKVIHMWFIICEYIHGIVFDIAFDVENFLENSCFTAVYFKFNTFIHRHFDHRPFVADSLFS